VSGTGYWTLLTLDGLPGFALFLTRKGRMVYGVEYGKDGELTRKMIGTVNKVSFKKARKLAAKLLLEKQITGKPTQTETTPKPAQTQIGGAKRQTESSLTNDRAGPRQTKAPDLTNSTAKFLRKLVTFDELRETYSIPLGRRQIDRLEKAGKFPKRVPIGERRVAWVASEIEAYVEQRIANRSTTA
jgi:prophage regulatory protein